MTRRLFPSVQPITDEILDEARRLLDRYTHLVGKTPSLLGQLDTRGLVGRRLPRYNRRMPRDDGAAERFAAVLDLYAFAVAQMRANLRRRHPDLSEEERERLLAAWLVDRPGAPEGDSTGYPRSPDLPPRDS